MSEVIMVLEEPWYNTLTEQMFEQVIEEIQPEPFIVSSELDNEINKAVLDLLHNPHEGVGLVEITNRYKMIRVTDNKEVKETVLAGLKHNKDKYGKRYCPCSLIRDEDTVCMCKEFREMEEGTCHCQLYVKTKE